MEVTLFKQKLNKAQLEATAQQTVKDLMEHEDALDVLLLAKRLLFFAESMKKDAENEAMLIWNIKKQEHPEMTYTQGGAELDYTGDDEYMRLYTELGKRKELLNFAFKSKDDIYDHDGVKVPKMKIKGYRKDSINVKL